MYMYFHLGVFYRIGLYGHISRFIFKLNWLLVEYSPLFRGKY